MGRPELEDRRQTARLNLVVSAPSTPVPVRMSYIPVQNVRIVVASRRTSPLAVGALCKVRYLITTLGAINRGKTDGILWTYLQ